jgi:DNA-binding phage protein
MKNEIIDKKDWTIDSEDYNTTYAKILSKNPERLQTFRRHTIEKYNKTKDLAIFLEDLKIISIAERNIATLARKCNMKRPNIYRFLSKDSNPTFTNLLAVVNNLGMDFELKAV